MAETHFRTITRDTRASADNLYTERTCISIENEAERRALDSGLSLFTLRIRKVLIDVPLFYAIDYQISGFLKRDL